MVKQKYKLQIKCAQQHLINLTNTCLLYILYNNSTMCNQ